MDESVFVKIKGRENLADSNLLKFHSKIKEITFFSLKIN